MPEVSDFLDQVISQDFASAAPTFKDIMGDLVQGSLEQEKVKLANQVFNGVDPEERAANDQYVLDNAEDDVDVDDEEELEAGAEEALDAEDQDDDYEDGEMEEDDSEPEDEEEEQ